MPIYQYQCQSCSAIYDEFWASFSEAEENEEKFIAEGKCPACESTAKKKIMSAPMVQFQGEGWTNKSIVPNSSGKTDSTDSLRDQAARIKEETNKLTRKDFYGDIKV